MGHQRSRAVFVGLSAAAAAFAAAAMLSAATPPTARADDPLTDITNDVQDELGYAQAAFSQAATDFSNNDPTDGLDQLFIGTDDDLVGVPDVLAVGTTDALTGAPVISDTAFEFSFATPATLALATTEAQKWYTEGVTLSNDITNLSPTDYADNALDNALSTADQWILPGEILSIGDFISFGF